MGIMGSKHSMKRGKIRSKRNIKKTMKVKKNNKSLKIRGNRKVIGGTKTLPKIIRSLREKIKSPSSVDFNQLKRNIKPILKSFSNTILKLGTLGIFDSKLYDIRYKLIKKLEADGQCPHKAERKDMTEEQLAKVTTECKKLFDEKENIENKQSESSMFSFSKTVSKYSKKLTRFRLRHGVEILTSDIVISFAFHNAVKKLMDNPDGISSFTKFIINLFFVDTPSSENLKLFKDANDDISEDTSGSEKPSNNEEKPSNKELEESAIKITEIYEDMESNVENQNI